jgi:pyruvate dehydrogenase E1 component
VLKVIWGSYWDPLLAKDKEGILLHRMEEAVDGEYQKFKSRDGAYVREHFFGKYPELRAMVANMSDADIWRLNRGGHDPNKMYAAYAAAVKHEGQPTVILAKTVKGYGMGAVGEGKNIAHQQKKMPIEALKQFRDRFNIPIPDGKLEELPYFKPADDSPEMKYLRERRAALGGSVPQRRRRTLSLEVPKLESFKPLLDATAEGREVSTTMAFVRMLTALVKDKNIGKYVVPIVPDESRTFGMEGLFRQLGIYSSVGQLYEPEDSDQLMFYKEDTSGQILQEGINEAGAMCSWMAAATSYSNNNVPMVPFYIFYSMFGMQRIGDLAWAAGDMRARGFLLGGTAGRTTLNGEGLQHEDGHSQVLASVIPNCRSYDPTFSYEVAVIVQDGLKRMLEDQEDAFYYITLMNENYPHPGFSEKSREGILKGMYQLSDGGAAKGPRVQLLGSGTILREVMAAATLLRDDWGVTADIWSCPSFNELRRDGMAVSRWNLLNATAKPRASWVEQCLGATKGPVVASTDYMRAFADQIREYVPRRYKVLGTDGFGRSDSRDNLRRFFEVDRHYVVIAALKALAEDGEVPAAKVAEAVKKYGIDTAKPAPWTV